MSSVAAGERSVHTVFSGPAGGVLAATYMARLLKEENVVSIDIGGGNIITATISCAAVEELNLKVGSDAYAVIKATNVMVGIDE